MADQTGKAYRKVGALIIRDRRMLLISATAAPDVYSMPGGPQRGTHQTITLAEELHAELGLTLTHAELWGEYEVVSGIDGVLVRSMIYLTEADGEPRALQAGRRWLWAGRIEGLTVSTTVVAVYADAVAQGLVGGADGT